MQARRAVRDYLDEVRRTDISAVDGITRDPERVRRLLQSLARNVATRTPVTTLASDAAEPGGSMTDATARGYLAALTRLMIIEDQPSWTPHLRSKSDLRTTPARHFVDPSLAVAALGASPEQLLRDLTMFGLLFESLVVRDLRIYAQAFGSRVKQYRDNKGVEVDAIVETDNGRWAAFEIKLAAGGVQEGVDSLRAFAAKVDTTKMGVPSVLGVITGSGYGYVREDGVHVIPIGALGPWWRHAAGPAQTIAMIPPAYFRAVGVAAGGELVGAVESPCGGDLLHVEAAPARKRAAGSEARDLEDVDERLARDAEEERVWMAGACREAIPLVGERQRSSLEDRRLHDRFDRHQFILGTFTSSSDIWPR